MKIARNYAKGVQINHNLGTKKSKSKKKYNKKDKLIAEICEKCPYSTCKKGVCDYFKEQEKLILGGANGGN